MSPNSFLSTEGPSGPSFHTLIYPRVGNEVVLWGQAGG